MSRTLLLALALPALFACASDEGGTMLEILNSPAPNTSCVFVPEAQTFVSRTSYDPRGAFGMAPTNCVVAVAITNHMATAKQDPAIGFETADNRRPDANDALLMGFDVCWLRADPEGGPAEAVRYDAYAEGIPEDLTCDRLPAGQKGFIPSAATVQAGGGSVAVVLNLLGITSLRSLYGDGFNPVAIPDVGNFPGDMNLDGDTTDPLDRQYSFLSSDPAATNRSAAWGSYPPRREAPVILQLRAVAKRQAGGSVRSNWFVFSVGLCVGCVAGSCGDLGARQCSDSSIGFSGFVPTFEDVCLPFQYGTNKCSVIDTCPKGT